MSSSSVQEAPVILISHDYELVGLYGLYVAQTGLVLVRVSIAVKRHHDHSNSYKGKHLIGWLTFQNSNLLSSWWDMQCAGKHDAGEGAENSISQPEGNRK